MVSSNFKYLQTISAGTIAGGMFWLNSVSLVQALLIDSNSFLVSEETTGSSIWGGGGRTSQQTNGSTHGPCDMNVSNQERMVALIPKRQNWITTTDEHPTFWFYLPAKADEFASVKFVLHSLDRTQTPLYSKFLEPTEALPGVIQIKIPDTVPALETARSHEWLLILTCKEGTELPLRNTVTRVLPSPELTADLRMASTPEAKSAAYFKHGIWLNALKVVGDRHSADLSNVPWKTQWKKLLEDEHVNLQRIVPGIADKPIVNCCRSTGE
ncbi:MAG: DUF928 domain-containing protein [Timaviella obliquedivisa GSE-PSE-MK23-08B]|jgi:hypothetical protein|nr:DUF928 domain-containing protein [Timaviella obliquedivisa GSE-PSE-MK23-08B]